MATSNSRLSTVPRAPLVLVTVAALAAAIPAALLAGAVTAAVAGLPDPGALVRWGVVLVRAIHDLAAALTVGLLVLAAFVVPEGPSTSRRVTAMRWAAASGVVWVVAGVVGLVFSFADLAGVKVSDPGFGQQLQAFVFSIDALRAAAISVGLALVVATGAALARSRAATVALALVSVVALLPLALAGHAAGSADHDTAVNSLGAHLVGAVLWVGGLMALVVLRPVLDRALGVSVARYSTMAGWCFVVVAVSGVLNAALRVGSFAGLATSYGVLVLLKATALVILGVAGWRQRTVVVGRLAADPLAGRAFARLAVLELAVMGAAFGLATALSRSAPPAPQVAQGDVTPVQSLTGYPPPAPLTSASWFTVWRVDWLWLAVAVVAVGLYVAGIARLHRRGDSWSPLRAISWTLGWAIFVYATSGAPNVYGRVLFSAHMTMHMVVSMAVPILLVLAAPVTMALRTLTPRPDRTLGPRELLLGLVHSRYLNVLGNPVVAAGLFFGSLVVFYYTPLFELALRTHTGHVLMTVHFLLTGYLFAWVLVGVDPGPKRWPPSLRLLVLFATISFHAFFGVALTTGTTLLAPDFFHELHLSWGPDLLADQRQGGAIAWGIGELPTLVLAMLVAAAWVRSDAAETRRRDRQADRDDDAELKAYNARLAAASAADRAAADRAAAGRGTSGTRPTSGE
jgi:cytochrome c oxidase assembly factor CtaG/putative copper export protein